MRVLIIDDDDDVRFIAKLTLEQEGSWRVEVASSGEEGIARARRFCPDLILLDVQMPGLDGLATLDALRREPLLAASKVIFLTAGRPHDAGLSAGVVGVLEKPFDPRTLTEEIRRLMETP
ncbi:MAG: response regulator [Deltaproteobacteria bacterium]|nr:MAG: response regulator [Deltaproteobacteria bacterium]